MVITNDDCFYDDYNYYDCDDDDDEYDINYCSCLRFYSNNSNEQ